MSLTYVGTGTNQVPTFATATPLSVSYPASVTAGDLLVMMIGGKPNTATITTPSGWTASGTTTGGAGVQGSGTGLTLIAAFTKTADGTEGGTSQSVALASSPNIFGGFMYQLRSTSGLYSVLSSVGADNSAGSAWSVTGGTSLDFLVGDIMVNGLCIPTNATTGSWTSENVAIGTGSLTFNLSSTPYGETTSGNLLAIRGTPMSCNGAGTATPVHTATVPATNTNVAGAEVFLRVREVVASNTGGFMDFFPI